MEAGRHEERRKEQERSLQRTTDKLEDHIEELGEHIDEARQKQATRREEADLTDTVAGEWRHRARDDEGPFGVLGGPLGSGGGTRSEEELEREAARRDREGGEDPATGDPEDRGEDQRAGEADDETRE